MASKQATRAGNIREFEIFQTDGGKSIDASPAVTDIRYYENVLSPTVTSLIIPSLSRENNISTLPSSRFLIETLG